MSRLENETKPILESILDDKIKAMGVSAQLTLARWTVKTAMVLEAIDSSWSWFYSENERSLMREAQTIPRRTEIWTAKCVFPLGIYSAGKDFWTSPNRDGVHAFSTTMSFGSLTRFR